MKSRVSFPLLLAAIIILFSQSGCKENVLFDAGISPSDNALGVYDTSLDIITHTFYEDTALTGLYTAGFPINHGIGNMSDPFFGVMTSSSYIQLLPVNPSNLVYENKTIDSAFLILTHSGKTYGDTTDHTPVPFQVYFLNEGLTAGTTYNSNTVKEADLANPLSDILPVDVATLSDSVGTSGSVYHDNLRIPLRVPALLSRLLPALDAATGASDAKAAFSNVFKGLTVRVADSRVTSRAMPYFLMSANGDAAGVEMVVYYHTSGGSDTLNQRYYFAGDECGFFNGIKRSNSHSPVTALLNSTAANDSVIGMQNIPGPGIDLVIPGISRLPSGVINKAEIQLALLPWYRQTNYSEVDRLFPARINGATYPAGAEPGVKSPVLDMYSSLLPFTIINGELHTLNRNGTDVETYTINLPREVMASLRVGNDTLHIRLNGTELYPGAYRSVMGGGSHPNPLYRAKLFVVYSALN